MTGQERGDEALDLLWRAGLVDRPERDQRSRERNHEVRAVAGQLLDKDAGLDPARGRPAERTGMSPLRNPALSPADRDVLTVSFGDDKTIARPGNRYRSPRRQTPRGRLGHSGGSTACSAISIRGSAARGVAPCRD